MSAYCLEGRTALVTGASRGIGAASARALAEAGARVALVARSQDQLDQLAESLAAAGPPAVGRAAGGPAAGGKVAGGPVVLAADLRDANQVTGVARRALEVLGRVDVLVNNAALGARLPTVDTGAELIDDLLAVNIRAPLLLIAALIPAMSEGGRGSIINLSSVSGLVGTPKRAAYAASKGAIDAATRSLAAELGPVGIRVNSVAPGVVDTDMWASNKKIPGVEESIDSMTPLRRWAQPDDIADVIVFLASDASRFITGETISVDGGLGHTLNLFGGPV